MFYTPKLSHAIVAAVLCVLFLAIGGKTQGRVAFAFNIGALMFGVLFLVVVILLALEGLNHRVEVMTDWMREFVKLDDEGRAAVAFVFPYMRYRMKRGVVREYFEDTNATIEQFRLFLKTSNDRYISPKRDWQSADMPEWAWLEIQGWLQDHDYILADSAAGSHSWLWKGEAYKHLMAYWMAGRRVENMSYSGAN